MLLIEATLNSDPLKLFRKHCPVILKNLRYIYSGKRFDKLDFDHRYCQVSYKSTQPYFITEQFQKMTKWINQNKNVGSIALGLLDDIDAGVVEEIQHSGETWDSEKEYSQNITDSQLLKIASLCK
jgi:hypothetical protein